MTDTEILAKLDKLCRPLITSIPGSFPIKFYSNTKDIFLDRLVRQTSEHQSIPDIDFRVRLWDLNFSCPLFNSAGMFKKGDGYYSIASQGAGAFLVGTSTAIPRKGNKKYGVKHPFVPLPSSNASLNWMGLPNKGHYEVATRISNLIKMPLCPIGASLSASPEHSGQIALNGLLDGMVIYDKANVDFIEINESCPNVPHEHSSSNEHGLDQSLIDRLEFISINFLKKRNRNLPVIVKLSNDTDILQVNALIDLLLDLKFDGINFGNTSIKYKEYEHLINENEQNLYRKFTSDFGGGLSGAPLKESSLKLASKAVSLLNEKNLSREFHIIRTGGIDSPVDILNSELAGIKLNQWYTGYFKNYSNYGNSIYKEFFDEMKRYKK